MTPCLFKFWDGKWGNCDKGSDIYTINVSTFYFRFLCAQTHGKTEILLWNVTENCHLETRKGMSCSQNYQKFECIFEKYDLSKWEKNALIAVTKRYVWQRRVFYAIEHLSWHLVFWFNFHKVCWISNRAETLGLKMKVIQAF